jgi:hypothetical protein
MKKEIIRYDAEELKEKRNKAVTLSFNSKIYEEFKIIMQEQGLVPSAVLNQFMKLSNKLLKTGSGEVCFVFKENKKEEASKK